MFKFALDHLPIVLALKGLHLGPYPFWFLSVWCDHLELQRVVKDGWKGGGGSIRSFWRHLNEIRGAV